ncbi:MAG TPA: DUF6325 family protein [Ktedonobacteraceae bacterium]|nr:DUF6325 family protein [Ktedonobacteraceae bacterium]
MAVALGPLEYMVIGCPGNQFMNEIVPELNAIQEKGLIQVVDLLFVRKAADGTITALEVSDLDDHERAVLGPIQQSLLGLITPEDVVTLSSALPADTSATIVLLEHLWLNNLEQAVERTNGVIHVGGMIPYPTLQQVRQEIEAVQAQNQDQNQPQP